MLFHMVVSVLLSMVVFQLLYFLLVAICQHPIKIFEISVFETGFEIVFETGLGGLVEIG